MAQKEYQRQWYLRKKAGLVTNTRHIGKHECKICGKWFDRVGSHVVQVHHITAREYRKEFGFDLKRGQVTDEYRETMREHVFENGTIENLKKGESHRFVKGHKINYERSEQTQERLKEHWKKVSQLSPASKKSPRITIKCARCGKEKEVIITSKQKYCGLVCANKAKVGK